MAEQQLNLIKKGVGRGGSRSGAGRKRSTHGSKVIRVPISYVEAVDALIDFLDNSETLENEQVSESKDIFVVSNELSLKSGSSILKLKVKRFVSSNNNQNEPTKTPE